MLVAAGMLMLMYMSACQPSQPAEPRHVVFSLENRLPEDCREAIRTYIDSHMMHAHPERAVGAFRRLALKYPRDSAAYAVMKCYEGQAWDVLRVSDSMLSCYDDASLYLEAHPQLIDLRVMSYLFSGWAHYYKKNRLTANYYFNKAGNELEDTQYVKGGAEYITSGYSIPARVALFTEIAGNAHGAGLQEQARHYIQRALNLAPQLGDTSPDLKAFALLEAGLIYTMAHEVDSGKAFFARAIPLIAQLQDTTLLITYYDHRGEAFLATRQYDSSLAAFQNLMQLQETVGASGFDAAQTAEGIADSYIGLGLAEEARLAIATARPVLYADTTAPLPERFSFSRTYLRYLLYGTTAGPVFERFVTQSDSVFDQQRLNAISDMDAQYGLQKKEARIQRLNKENKDYSERVAAQQTLLIVSILIIALLAAVLALLQQFQRRRRLIAERDKAVLEQRLLRSQMEPHFIFNTISVLQSLVRQNERELSIKYLSKFARLLRISLENAREELVPLTVEIEALQHYLSLQQVRFRNVFTYTIETYEGYGEEADELLIPPMLLQPFVENAIQHGMVGMKDNAGLIRISVQKDGKNLRFLIEDNGAEDNYTRQKDPYKKSSLSTTITRERLSLLSRQAGMPTSLDIVRRPQSSGGGMLVKMIIPFQ